MSEQPLQLRYQLGYPEFTLDLALTLPATGITALFGPSGSGKTSLLRCIAGLEKPQQGFLSVAGEVWHDQHNCLPPHRRPVGYVFQEASLFPHLTAGDNLQFALRRADAGPPLMTLEHAVELLNIGHLLNRAPGHLSGGERQRIAIARALLINPQLLLLDEPLAALDQARKQEILPYLEQLHRELSIPMIYVSHSPDEVARLADYLVILQQGQAVASGPMRELMARVDLPLPFGEEPGVVWEATVAERDEQWHLTRVTGDGGDLWLRDVGVPVGNNVRLRIQAKDVSLALERHSDTSIVNALPATIVAIDQSAPGLAMVQLQVGKEVLLAQITQRSLAHLALAPGKPVYAQIKSAALIR